MIHFYPGDISLMIGITKPKLIICEERNIEDVISVVKSDVMVMAIGEPQKGVQSVRELFKETGCENNFK